MLRTNSSSAPILTVALPPGRLLTIRRLRGPLADADLGPRRYLQHAILLAEAPSSAHAVDLAPHPLPEGRVAFLRPGQVQHFLGPEVDVTEIHFSAALLDRETADAFPRAPHVDPPAPARRRLAALVAQIAWEYDDGDPDWNMIRPLLAALLLALARLSRVHQRPPTPPRHDARVERLRALIASRCTIQASASDYARHLHLSSKRLNELTRAYVGKTVSQMARETVMIEARRALALSDERIKTISFRLGFEDASYFSRFFRREAGETPSAFRERMQASCEGRSYDISG